MLFLSYIRLSSALRYPLLFVQLTFVLLRFVQTKKVSRLIHRWRGGCLVIVYLKNMYVILRCFVFS